MKYINIILLGCLYAVYSPVIVHAAYPYQGQQQFKVEGILTMVDGDRERASLTTSTGKQYDLDTQNAEIRLRDTSKPVTTDRLIEGMHVSVSGTLLSHDIIAVDKLSVLPYTGSTIYTRKPVVATEAAIDEPFRMRGTVVSVDDQSGMIIVRVNDHTRSIYVNQYTDLTDIHSSDDSKIGIAPGNRVTIVGVLRADGGVNADAISFNKNIEAAGWSGAKQVSRPSQTSYPYIADIHSRNLLFGTVTYVADKYTSRDIKIRGAGNTEVTIHVPHEASVIRSGKPISMHDLANGDSVKVSGSWDGNDFKAMRIVVDNRDDKDY